MGTWDLSQMPTRVQVRHGVRTATSKTYVWIACTKELWECEGKTTKTFLKRAKTQRLAFCVMCDKEQKKFWVQIRGFRPIRKGGARSVFEHQFRKFDVYRPGEDDDVVMCVNLAQIMAEACGKTGVAGRGGVVISPAAQRSLDNATAKEVRARREATNKPNKQTNTQTRWI